jgi:hypothetical protein
MLKSDLCCSIKVVLYYSMNLEHMLNNLYMKNTVLHKVMPRSSVEVHQRLGAMSVNLNLFSICNNSEH